MCGIFGLVARRDAGLQKAQWVSAVERLFVLSETRGKEAAGIAIATSRNIVATKDSVSATEMMKTSEFAQVLNSADRWFADAANGPTLAAIGHSRLVTNGLQGIDANNQPVWRDEIIMIHNGIVVNVDELWAREKADGIVPSSEVDTEVIAALISKYRKSGDSPETAISKVYSDIYGETSIALFLRDTASLHLATNTGSLYLCRNASNSVFFFASEKLICERLVSGKDAIPGFSEYTIEQLRAGHGATINMETLETSTYRFGDDSLNSPSYAPLLATQRAIEDKASKIEAARRNIRRCIKCILPETMPFIAFDADGVCNYCHDYKPWVKRPESDLRDRLDRARSRDGSPDCIVAFSGGRDSSYGLHVLKEEYGMTPLTFSYDWGMVTDLARRNQARICGKLGIEHIWISADIKQKRAHIRRNVLAWLRQPDLGIIPLFMAGDKEVLWHANKLMDTYKIAEMAFCTNDLEKTVFKQGFLGIDARETTIHKPSTLPLLGKVGMLYKYGSRFARNPAYLNRSMADSLFAFFSYYVIKQNYFSLFDYLPWEEGHINDTLIGVYDWETAPDTDSTWRIGDGTAPFYNYIYYTVAGFTEYDTFRSNQIREGMLDRKTALGLVNAENQPRFKSIREYTQMINIDFDETVRTIDRIPKLYAKNA
jgi:asparagine synthetase B (glutamine-hydrolysing)